MALVESLGRLISPTAENTSGGMKYLFSTTILAMIKIIFLVWQLFIYGKL